MSQQTKDLVEEPAAAPRAVTPSPARLSLDGKDYELPVIVGTEDEHGVDIRSSAPRPARSRSTPAT